MSGTKHSDTHVEYILDTPTWLGPWAGTPFDRVQEIVWDQAPILYLVNRNALVALTPTLRNVQPATLDPRLVWNIDQIHFAPKLASKQ